MGATYARHKNHVADPLERAIETLLGAGPRLADQLAHETGYSLAATRQRLDRLLERGRVHREKVNLGQPRWQYLWHSGPAPVAAPVRSGELETEDDLFAPVQTTVRSYPPVGRRDSLVAALFGPARHR
jgi:hypothetical protein